MGRLGWTVEVGAAVFLFATASVALADTINFTQFGSDDGLNNLPNSISGTTLGGVGLTIIGPGNGFVPVEAGVNWAPSQFATGSELLEDEAYPQSPSINGSGPVTIKFATPITSITSLAAETAIFGPYTATLTAYDGATLLGASSYTIPGVGPPGSIPSLAFSAAAITSITIGTTNDSQGFALGPSSNPVVTPLPSTWTMLTAGFVVLFFFAYRGKKKNMGALV
jgi:hypothetical protein